MSFLNLDAVLNLFECDNIKNLVIFILIPMKGATIILTRFDCGTLPLGSVLLNWRVTKER